MLLDKAGSAVAAIRGSLLLMNQSAAEYAAPSHCASDECETLRCLYAGVCAVRRLTDASADARAALLNAAGACQALAKALAEGTSRSALQTLTRLQVVSIIRSTVTGTPPSQSRAVFTFILIEPLLMVVQEFRLGGKKNDCVAAGVNGGSDANSATACVTATAAAECLATLSWLREPVGTVVMSEIFLKGGIVVSYEAFARQYCHYSVIQLQYGGHLASFVDRLFTFCACLCSQVLTNALKANQPAHLAAAAAFLLRGLFDMVPREPGRPCSATGDGAAPGEAPEAAQQQLSPARPVCCQQGCQGARLLADDPRQGHCRV